MAEDWVQLGHFCLSIPIPNSNKRGENAFEKGCHAKRDESCMHWDNGSFIGIRDESRTRG